MHHPTILSTLTAILAALPAAEAGLYSKKSPVLQIDGKSYKTLIENSQHTSIVEFYAPWCGHCKNLQPAYEKVAKNLDGLVKVAAVDCDEESNKGFCGQMGVQGFPTLKIIRPSKKAGGKPVVEDYQGPRTATGIQEAVVSKMNNHVVKLTQSELMSFFNKDGIKGLLFTEKGSTSALMKSLAIDFLDKVSIGQLKVTDKEKEVAAKLGIDKFPTFVVLPDKETSPAYYKGEMKKADIVEFLKTWAEPNVDGATKKGDKKKGDKKDKKAKEPAAETEEAAEEETAETTAQPAAPSVISINTVDSFDALAESCLTPKAHTCVLAFVPSPASTDGETAVGSLSALNTKYIRGDRHMFPFLSVPSTVEGSEGLKSSLGLKKDVELVALSARRKWLRVYDGDFSETSVESWIDAVRMGDGEKKKLPAEVIVEAVEAKTEAKEASSEATQATDAEPEAETAGHDEL